MRGLHSHSRECRKIFLRDHFSHISQIVEGIHFGANTCRACIRTRANAGKYSWQLFMYWFRARGEQTRVYPYPLGAGSARPNPKMGAPDPENPLFLGLSVLGGVETMVSDHGLGRGQTIG